MLLVDLFELLVEWIHTLGLRADRESIYARLFPDEVFNTAKWNKLSYELLQQIEDCLIYLRRGEDEFRQRIDCLALYRDRGLTRHLRTRVKRYGAKPPKHSAAAGMSSYEYDYQLEKTNYYLTASSKRSDKHNLPEQEEALLRSMFAAKFRQTCETLAHLRIFRRDFQIPLLEAFEEAYAMRPQAEVPGVHLFYLATRLYREADPDPAFFALKQGIETHIDTFPHEDQRNLLVLAINYCLRQSNAGRADFLRETLDLYRLGLQRALFYENGQIGSFTFNNILGVALRLDEADWAELFLEENVKRLSTDKREELESLSRARLSFLRKDYDQTLKFLRTADYQDFIHHLTARIMQLKIWFERDDFNLLTSHIRSTKSLLRRKKNLGYHQRNYLNIFTLAEKVLRLTPGDQAAKLELRQQIVTTEPCTEKEWLIQAVDQDF